MQHRSVRAAARVAAAALLLLCWLCVGLPRARAAKLEEVHGIRVLSFQNEQILSIGNQTAGKCSWYALRYARTILDGKTCSGAGMWSNGAVWSAAGYTTYTGSKTQCPRKSILSNEQQLVAVQQAVKHDLRKSFLRRRARFVLLYQ